MEGLLGWSVHIGVNEPDRRHYPGVSPLRACEADATALAALAGGRGFEPHVLLGPAATTARVLTALRDAAARLEAPATRCS